MGPMPTTDKNKQNKARAEALAFSMNLILYYDSQ